jgi:tetrapyrrole methylase family protein/MazG family protein
MIKKRTHKTAVKRIKPINPVRNSRKASKLEIRSLLDGIPEGLPSLLRANLITRRVSRAGFDWPDLKGVLSKMEEEMQEVQQALLLGDKKKIREEIGDLLFVLTNLARFLKIDPEDALRRTIEKFISRFKYIEVSLLKKGKTIHQSNLIEMDSLWEEAKQKRHQK